MCRDLDKFDLSISNSGLDTLWNTIAHDWYVTKEENLKAQEYINKLKNKVD